MFVPQFNYYELTDSLKLPFSYLIYTIKHNNFNKLEIPT